MTILVVRDFDLYGFRIAHTLCHDTRRYKFKTPPTVIDLGLRLKDAEVMRLDSEETEYDANPIADLTKYGATEDEIKFLVTTNLGYGGAQQWTGRRIELNEMDSETLVQWLESKLTEAKNDFLQNKLLECGPNERLDSRTTATPSGADSELATVESVYRPEIGSR